MPLSATRSNPLAARASERCLPEPFTTLPSEVELLAAELLTFELLALELELWDQELALALVPPVEAAEPPLEGAAAPLPPGIRS